MSQVEEAIEDTVQGLSLLGQDVQNVGSPFQSRQPALADPRETGPPGLAGLRIAGGVGLGLGGGIRVHLGAEDGTEVHGPDTAEIDAERVHTLPPPAGLRRPPPPALAPKLNESPPPPPTPVLLAATFAFCCRFLF